MSAAGLEIERKYLIRMPDAAQLEAMPQCEIWDIVQTYLCDGADGSTRRVRSIGCGGRVRYVKTIKHRRSVLSSREEECDLSPEEYERLIADANPELRPVIKRRYRIPYLGQLLEIDIYSFWTDRATLEIELESEDQQIQLPPWLETVREVSGDWRYRNRFLAAEVPMDEL